MIRVVDPPRTGKGWQDLWGHYLATPPVEPTWVASPWPVLEEQEHYYLPGRALPCQEDVPAFSEHDRQAREKRHRQLGRWLPPGIPDNHDFTLEVFRATNDLYLRNSGVLYGQAHHRLKVQHGMRRRIMEIPGKEVAAGLGREKCTICHVRPALGNEHAATGHIDSLRQQVSELWKNRDLDPEQQGSERLCPVCAVRRFLSRSDSGKPGNTLNSFNQVCFGPEATIPTVQDRDGRVRTPFPSTVHFAAQEYLAGLAENAGDYAALFADIMGLHDQLGLGRPSFIRALPRLAAAADKHSLLERFLELDPQLALFPGMVQARLQYETDTARKLLWEKLVERVRELRKKADKNLGGPPATQVAVITMDGDRMGSLLLGDPDRIQACWRDVLHPEVDEWVQENLEDTGWKELRLRNRQAGPALHAFISRALADFNHHVAPWVVEQEFGGRLIYCGGDDLLALVPLRDALPMAARLRQLFSSPWLVDTRPRVRPWSWLESGATTPWNPSEAKNRFQIIDKQEEPKKLAGRLRQGRLLPMLGRSGWISAGISCGHFKTRLGLLVQTSHELLDNWAKDRAGRNAVGLGHFSRNGIKTMYAAPWEMAPGASGIVAQPRTAMTLIRTVEEVTKKGFQEGRLPKSLPYKLARSVQLLNPGRLDCTPGERLRLLRGILGRAVDGKKLSIDLEDAVLNLWAAGYRLQDNGNGEKQLEDPERECRNDQIIAPLAGLFFCRYLHQQGGQA